MSEQNSTVRHLKPDEQAIMEKALRASSTLVHPGRFVDRQSTDCLLPDDKPAICPECGATSADRGCRIDSPNKPVLAEIARLHADPDRRVTELLEANNREVERRRRAEAELAQARDEIKVLRLMVPVITFDGRAREP